MTLVRISGSDNGWMDEWKMPNCHLRRSGAIAFLIYVAKLHLSTDELWAKSKLGTEKSQNYVT